MSRSLRRLKNVAQQQRADVIIGKNGLSPGVLKEIDRHLEEKEVVKVKALRSAIKVTGLDRRKLAQRVAEILGARLLDVRGRTFILYRARRGSLESKSLRQRYKTRSSGSQISGEKKSWLRRLRFQQIY